MLIKNGLIIHADGERQEDIRISGEQFTDVGSNLPPKKNETVFDAHGKWIFPGIIDPHTHMGIPIKDQWSADNFDTGTRSALNSGVTTIIDFTILEHNQTLRESIAVRKKYAKESHCDVGLHCNFTRFSPALLEEIPEVIKEGIISFKVFTTYREAGMMLNYDEIEKTACVIGRDNGILMVHAEDDDEIISAAKRIPVEKRTDPYSHGLSRPDIAEEKAVKKLVNIAEKTQCPVYIVHLNSAKGFAVARTSRRIMIETCPHYLLLDDSYYKWKDGRMFVASPPLRKPEDADILWQGVLDDQIHTIGTDHCPFCLAQKQTRVSFDQIPNGMGGVETLFPVMLAQWVKRNLPKSQLTKLISTRPATIFQLAGKGVIAPGMDADLVIVNPDHLTEDWQHRLVSTTDWNAYSGFPALFPEHVFLRGNHIVNNGEIETIVKGKFIPGYEGDKF